MDTKFKKSIDPRENNPDDKLGELAPIYNMPDLILASFERNYGYCKAFSAPDVVHSVTALLELGVA
jgi:hypothetical protein